MRLKGPEVAPQTARILAPASRQVLSSLTGIAVDLAKWVEKHLRNVYRCAPESANERCIRCRAEVFALVAPAAAVEARQPGNRFCVAPRSPVVVRLRCHRCGRRATARRVP